MYSMTGTLLAQKLMTSGEITNEVEAAVILKLYQDLQHATYLNLIDDISHEQIKSFLCSRLESLGISNSAGVLEEGFEALYYWTPQNDGM